MSRDFYDLIARYYEPMQEDIDPDEIAGTVEDLAAKFCLSKGQGEDGRKILADLGCGTGNITAVMSQRYGYETIGIDNSEGMLAVASQHHPDLLWVMQDIRQIELAGKCDIFTCLTDTLNHLTDQKDIDSVFASICEYLAEGGVLIFDCATKDNLENTLGSNVFFQDLDNMTLLWDNSYLDGLSTSEITLFYTDDGINYKRADTVVYERYYSGEFWKDMAERHGLEIVHKRPGFDGERDIYVMRRK